MQRAEMNSSDWKKMFENLNETKLHQLSPIDLFSHRPENRPRNPDKINWSSLSVSSRSDDAKPHTGG